MTVEGQPPLVRSKGETASDPPPVEARKREWWEYAPLGAWVAVCVPMAVVFLVSDLAQDATIVLGFIVVFAVLANWPFGQAFVVTQRLIRQSPSRIAEVRVIMWSALVPMLIPSIFLNWVIVFDFDRPWPAFYHALTYAVVGLLLVEPVLGMIGWFVGTLIAPRLGKPSRPEA
jgi:hypothetical protein